MIRIVSALLILWGCAFAQAPIDIVSRGPLGMPCGGISTLGCMPDKDCGWMVIMKTGDAAAFSGKLTYTDAEGKEQTAIATATATGEYTALAFRVGVFRNGGNRFVSVEVSSLKASATVRQDAEGAIITVGETTWGPPVDRLGVIAGWDGIAWNFPTFADTSASGKTPRVGWRKLEKLESGDTLFKAALFKAVDGITWSNSGPTVMLWVSIANGKLKIEQPPLCMHTAEVRSALDLLATIGASFGIHNGTARKFEPLNLKEYHQ